MHLIFLLLALTTSLMGGVKGAPAHNNRQLQPRDRIPRPQGFSNTLFFEDFTTYTPGSQPSTDKWTFDSGHGYPGGSDHWGTGEIESYTSSKDNLIVSPSRTLLITPQLSGGEWTSARIESKANGDFACPAGGKLLIQGKLKLKLGTSSDTQMGIWPAFWTLGARFRGTNDWPAVGEIDILESVNGADKVWNTAHCGVNPGGPCSEKTGVGGSAGFSRNQWHTLGLEIDRTNAGGVWREEKLTWFLDGTETFSLNGARVNDEAAWTPLTRDKKFMLLNVAVGGDMPNAIAQRATPTDQTQGGEDAALEVEWVAVYST